MKLLRTTFLVLLAATAICSQSRGSLATKTPLGGPTDVIVAANGDVYVVESDNCIVRKIDAKTRRITTVAGNGKNDYTGDGGRATSAALDYATSIALDAVGNLYIAEIAGRIRKVDVATQTITTIAGNGKMGDGGTGDGGLALEASFRRPDNIAFDGDGDLYIADDMDHRIRKIDMTTQRVSTFAGDNWKSMAAETAAGEVLGDGRLAKNAALYFPSSIAFDVTGNMYIADFQNHRIRRVERSTGIISTVAGNGIPKSTGDNGLAVQASIKYPQHVVVDKTGNVFFADSAGIHRIDAVNGRIKRISRHVGDLALDGTTLYVGGFGQNHIFKIDLLTKRLTVFAGNGLPERHDIIL